MRPTVFSGSSINTYNDCHLQWYFGYVSLEDGDLSEPLAVGIAWHDAIEQTLKGTLPPDAFEDDPVIGSLVKVFNADILPTYRDPVLIEAEFQLEINGIPYSGVIDALDRQDVPWGYSNILRDHKSTGSRPRQGKYRLPMTGYWLGAADLGYEPDAAQLDYVVRTRTPYYWPEPMDPITDDDIGILARVLETVAEGVAREDYRPTGLGTRACVSCPYKAICGPYDRFLKLTQKEEVIP